MKQRSGNGKSGIMGTMVVAVMISLGVMMLVCMIGAILISGEHIGENSIGYVSAAALISGTVIGGFIVAKNAETKKMLWCMVHGAACLIGLLCIGMLVFDGAMRGIPATAAMTLGGSCAAGIFSSTRKKRGSYGKKPYKI